MNQQEPTPEILQKEHASQQNAESAAPPAAAAEKSMPENACAPEGSASQPKEDPKPKDANADKCLKERLYDKVNVPIWVLDLVIGGCILAIIYCLIVGRG